MRNRGNVGHFYVSLSISYGDLCKKLSDTTDVIYTLCEGLLKKGEFMSSPQVCPISRLGKLLIATDRSVFSEGAIREAIHLANKCSSSLYVVSVMETNPEIGRAHV